MTTDLGVMLSLHPTALLSFGPDWLWFSFSAQTLTSQWDREDKHSNHIPQGAFFVDVRQRFLAGSCDAHFWKVLCNKRTPGHVSNPNIRVPETDYHTAGKILYLRITFSPLTTFVRHFLKSQFQAPGVSGKCGTQWVKPTCLYMLLQIP